MALRVTQGATNRAYLKNLNTSQLNMNRSMEKLETGRKFSRISDNVYEASKTLDLRAKLYKNNQVQNNVSEAIDEMAVGESLLAEMGDICSEVQAEMLKALNDPSSFGVENTFDSLLQQSKDEILRLSNKEYNNKFLLGGLGVEKQPFTVDDQGRFCYSDKKVAVSQIEGKVAASEIRGYNTCTHCRSDIDSLLREDAAAENKNVDELGYTYEHIGDSNRYKLQNYISSVNNAERDILVGERIADWDDANRFRIESEARDALEYNIAENVVRKKFSADFALLDSPEDKRAFVEEKMLENDISDLVSNEIVKQNASILKDIAKAFNKELEEWKNDESEWGNDGNTIYTYFENQMKEDNTWIEIDSNKEYYFRTDGAGYKSRKYHDHDDDNISQEKYYIVDGKPMNLSHDNYIDVGLDMSKNTSATSKFNITIDGVSAMGYGTSIDEETGMEISNNIYDMITEMQDALMNSDKDKLGAVLTNFKKQTENLVSSRAEVGVRSKFLDTTLSRLENENSSLENTKHYLEATDDAKEITYFRNYQNTWNLCLQFGGNIIPKSLMDYIR